MDYLSHLVLMIHNPYFNLLINIIYNNKLFKFDLNYNLIISVYLLFKKDCLLNKKLRRSQVPQKLIKFLYFYV